MKQFIGALLTGVDFFNSAYHPSDTRYIPQLPVKTRKMLTNDVFRLLWADFSTLASPGAPANELTADRTGLSRSSPLTGRPGPIVDHRRHKATDVRLLARAFSGRAAQRPVTIQTGCPRSVGLSEADAYTD